MNRLLLFIATLFCLSGCASPSFIKTCKPYDINNIVKILTQEYLIWPQISRYKEYLRNNTVYDMAKSSNHNIVLFILKNKEVQDANYYIIFARNKVAGDTEDKEFDLFLMDQFNILNSNISL